ncbi:MAG: trypsin-like peptidase domain-containing protein [bacterium]|nr:trypsin-like peptidase domain-containing protein [Candidatus Kapabacteria bacterium]
MHSTLPAVVAIALSCAVSASAQPVVLGAPMPPPPTNLSAKSLNEATIAVAKLANPCVVGVSIPIPKRVSKQWEYYDEFYGRGGRSTMPDSYKRRRVASGVIVTHDGYVITNHHVIEDVPEDSILVIMNDGDTYRAELIGSDKMTDIALLRVYGRNLPSAYIANSDSVEVGEWVLAVGNPMALRSTVTAGIVSAIGRTTPNDAADPDDEIEGYIQFDAAINPGNSGGGLFDLQGRLIGIVCASYTSTGYFHGYSLAIPTTIAHAVIDDIVEDGKVDRVWLGVAGADIVDTSARTLRLEKIRGMVINEVETGSPAESAGLRKSDVILSLDGAETKKLGDVQRLLVSRRPGTAVVLGIWRDGRADSVTVTLGRKPNKTLRDSTKTTRKGAIGISADDIAPDDVRREKLSASSGVYVTGVDPYGAAARAGVMRGDVIESIDDQNIPSLTVLTNEMRLRRPGDVMKVVLIRYGDRLTKEIMVERGW